MGFREDIFAAVAAIPKGKVSTYGRVAVAAGYPGAARAVGNTLHANTTPETVPCHRVVHADGSLGSGYAFGGPEAQKKKLSDEGVLFYGDRVILDKCLWSNGESVPFHRTGGRNCTNSHLDKTCYLCNQDED